MKTFILFFLFFASVLSVIVFADPPGWSDDIQITERESFQPLSAIDSHDQIHVLYTEPSGALLYYKKLDNEGNTIIPEMNITDIQTFPILSDIAVDRNDAIHLVWSQRREGGNNLYYKKLDNNGTNLIDDINLTYLFGNSRQLASTLVIDSEQNVHVVWADNRDSSAEDHNDLFYKKLDNNGNPLSAAIKLTNVYSRKIVRSMAIDTNDNLHILWDDRRYATDPIMGSPNLMYIKLDKHGNNLTPETRLTFIGNISLYIGGGNFAIDQQNDIHLVWSQYVEIMPLSNTEIYYMKLDNNGNNLTGSKRLTFAIRTSGLPKISIDRRNNANIVWTDDRSTPGDIYYMKLNNQGNNLTGDILAMTRWSRKEFPSLLMDSAETLHLIWWEYLYPLERIYYKHSLSPQFTIEGEPRIGNTINITLSDPLNPNIPYLFLMSLSNNTGVALGDGRKIPLDYDGLFEFSLFFPQYLGLNNAQGILDQNGTATVIWSIPNIPAAVGLNLSVGYITIYPERPVPQLINSISETQTLTLMP